MNDTCLVTYCGIELAVIFTVVSALVLLIFMLVRTIEKKNCAKTGHKMIEISTVDGRYARVCSCGFNFRFMNFD